MIENISYQNSFQAILPTLNTENSMKINRNFSMKHKKSKIKVFQVVPMSSNPCLKFAILNKFIFIGFLTKIVNCSQQQLATINLQYFRLDTNGTLFWHIS